MVLDTNVLVSGAAYPSSIPGRILQAWRQGALEVILSQYILDEVARVLPRLNDRLKWEAKDFADYVDILSLQADVVEPQPLHGDAARDAADIPVLGTLLASKADYLITGAADLLALASDYSIISPAEFWRKHGG